MSIHSKPFKINRQEKNVMRSHLEQVLEMHREIARKIKLYSEQTREEEYLKVWDELENRNRQVIKVISQYMVMKCNR